jgi:hypothetical protein
MIGLTARLSDGTLRVSLGLTTHTTTNGGITMTLDEAITLRNRADPSTG